MKVFSKITLALILCMSILVCLFVTAYADDEGGQLSDPGTIVVTGRNLFDGYPASSLSTATEGTANDNGYRTDTGCYVFNPKGNNREHWIEFKIWHTMVGIYDLVINAQQGTGRGDYNVVIDGIPIGKLDVESSGNAAFSDFSIGNVSFNKAGEAIIRFEGAEPSGTSGNQLFLIKELTFTRIGDLPDDPGLPKFEITDVNIQKAPNNDTVSVSLSGSNTTGEDKSCRIMLAFYKDDTLTEICSQTYTMSGTATENETVLTKEIPEGATEATAFVWGKLSTGSPMIKSDGITMEQVK